MGYRSCDCRAPLPPGACPKWQLPVSFYLACIGIKAQYFAPFGFTAFSNTVYAEKFLQTKAEASFLSGVISLVAVIGFVWALRRIKVEVLRLIRLRQVTGRGHSIARRVHHAAHSISLSLAPRCLVSPSVCPSSVSPVHRDRGRVCFQHFCRVQPQEDNQDGVNDAHTLTALVSQRNPPHPLPVVPLHLVTSRSAFVEERGRAGEPPPESRASRKCANLPP